MGESELDRKLSDLTDQLAEQFNLAISTAVDENKTFAQGEQIFRDAIAVLDYYGCGETAAEQLVNFSKVAYFRKEYRKALSYASEAVSRQGDAAHGPLDHLHAMAYRLFELVLVDSENTMDGLTLEDLQEILVPEDYCQALKNVYRAAKQVKSGEEQKFLAEMLRKLAIETVRQGIRREKAGEYAEALLLFQTVLPFLNPKRAAVIAEEIRKLEENSGE